MRTRQPRKIAPFLSEAPPPPPPRVVEDRANAADIVAAYLQRVAPSYRTQREIALGTGLTSSQANGAIYNLIRRDVAEAKLPADAGRRGAGQAYRWKGSVS